MVTLTLDWSEPLTLIEEYPIPEPESEVVNSDGVFFKSVGKSWAKFVFSRSFFEIFTNGTGELSFALSEFTVTPSRLTISAIESNDWLFWIFCE